MSNSQGVCQVRMRGVLLGRRRSQRGGCVGRGGVHCCGAGGIGAHAIFRRRFGIGLVYEAFFQTPNSLTRVEIQCIYPIYKNPPTVAHMDTAGQHVHTTMHTPTL